MPLSLKGKKILVTGVSREKGIGTAIVKKLLENSQDILCCQYDYKNNRWTAASLK